MGDTACRSMSHIQMCRCFIHCYAVIFLHASSTAAMPSDVTTRCAWPGRGESVTELMPFMSFLVYSYTYCSDRHASPYWTLIVVELRWVSPLHYLKNGWQNAVLLWCMLQVELPSLHYYCAVVLHSCIILPPGGRFSSQEYHCCQLMRQSSCVLNFYRTFKVFIWLSLMVTCQELCFGNHFGLVLVFCYFVSCFM